MNLLTESGFVLIPFNRLGECSENALRGVERKLAYGFIGEDFPAKLACAAFLCLNNIEDFGAGDFTAFEGNFAACRGIAYRVTEPALAIQDFVDELSNWYDRRVPMPAALSQT